MFNSLPKTMTPAREPMTGPKTRWAEQLLAYILLIPAVSIFAVFGWYPLIRTLVSSFFHVRLAGESTFVGLLNYRKMLADPLFITAWKNSLEFVLWSLLLGFLLPVVLDWWDFGLAATWNVGMAVILAVLSILLVFSRRESASR